MTTSTDFVSESKSFNDILNEYFSRFSQLEESDKDRIRKAWLFIIEKSEGKKRPSGEPYHLHPMRIAVILSESRLDTTSIVAGLLHNIFELENVSEKEVSELFGNDVVKIISETNRIANLKISSKTMQQADSFRKMLFAMIDDIRVILVKLADRLDRLRHLSLTDEASKKEIVQEVIDIWAPLANRLGMSNLKNELEDLSLKYTNPDIFQQLKKIVDMKKNERAEYLKNAEKAIYTKAERAGITISISSRAKHFYSIYQKMRKRNKSAEDLYDLLALRIICQEKNDCYSIIGIVHDLWKPLEGRFKDYIAMPKANGYQSLHTTVMCGGKPLEIQIRTAEMHNAAEHGVASHWLYKKGSSHDMVSIENLSIINQLKDLKKSHLDDEILFNEIKDELLGDSIFVFTPKGDVIELPAGSTAIDFAYAIHSAIGEKIIGAKADGHIIQLSSPLKNTEIIEILTSPQSHPTVNQLQFAKTAKAKSKIRSWLLANNLSEKPLSKDNSAQSSQKQVHPKQNIQGERPASKSTHTKVLVGNNSNFLITMAKCCEPKYGDEIVGYISRNRGVVVHKKDCKNYNNIPTVKERSIEVAWNED